MVDCTNIKFEACIIMSSLICGPLESWIVFVYIWEKIRPRSRGHQWTGSFHF